MRIFTLLLTLLTISVSTFAQQKISVTGNVYDRMTAKDLPHVQVAVLNPDSTLVAEMDAYDENYKFIGNSIQKVEEGIFTLDIPKASTPYIMRFSKDGYDTYFQPLDLSKLGAREFQMKLPPVYLTPVQEGPTVQLDEVVVKTSKIKFYHKGDTIVYNADAFMLPQGSTLDALIAQMPGVEIRDGGKIYVNGKYVESLLLNGKDFFKGNQDVLRQNIGAYAVKDVAVYDKYGEMSKLMGAELEDDKEYVMDVRLKKDYMGGFMGNAEASYGTDDRYSARLFAMHFNNNGRYSIYGNLNNVNNTNRPNDGQGYSWYTSAPSGISDIANGGLDYSIEDPGKKWSANGNVDANYINNTKATNTFKESFLQRKSFLTTLNEMNDKTFTISTNHEFKFNKELYYITLRPEFRYNRTRSTSETASVEFDKNVQEKYEINRSVIDALFSGSDRELREALINRNRFNRKNRSNNYRGYFWSEQALRFKGSPDAFNLWIEGEYTRDHSSSLTDQNIDYGFNGLDAPLQSSALRRENHGYPRYTAWMKGAGRYFVKARKTTFTLGYEFRHEQQRHSSLEFLFDTRTQDEEAFLPVDAELLPDLGNTNSSKLHANIHMIKGSFDYNNKWEKFELSLAVMPEFHLRWRNLDYNAYNMSEIGYYPITIPVKRSSASFNNSGVRLIMNTPDRKVHFYGYYRFNTRYVTLTDLIDIPNTVDPLNISHGNPNLKDAFQQTADIGISLNPRKNTTIYFNADLEYTSRDMVKGYTFNTTTGVRDFQTVNVSGNLSTSEQINFYKSMEFGNHELSWNAGVNYRFARYANMIGEDGPMRKQVVFSNRFGYSARVSYSLLKKYTIGANFRSYNRFSRINSSDRANTVERSYVPSGWINLKLPFNLQLNCEATYFKTTGNDAMGMNTDQCILNANLRYQLNDNWSFRIEGYDLLNQQKPFSYNVDASGRTSSYTNVLPRYCLFTVAYKFNTKKNK